jgi:DNA-directed RNA polymerase specialized sigma24 family protein
MLASKHQPNGGSSSHFDNVRLESLISAYHAGTDPAALTEIVRLTQTRALTLIRFHKTSRYGSEDELISDVNFELLRAVEKFDPAKGSAFTFVSCIIQNTLHTSVSKARTAASRYVELDEALASALPANGETGAGSDRDAIDDLVHRFKASVKTTLSNQLELSAQRWYIESFT